MRAVTFDETPVWWQELTLVGVDAHGMETWQGRRLYTFDLAQEWIRDGIYKVEGFVTTISNSTSTRTLSASPCKTRPRSIKIVLDCQ